MSTAADADEPDNDLATAPEDEPADEGDEPGDDELDDAPEPTQLGDDGSWEASVDEINAAVDAAGGEDAIASAIAAHRKQHPKPPPPDILAD